MLIDLHTLSYVDYGNLFVVTTTFTIITVC